MLKTKYIFLILHIACFETLSAQQDSSLKYLKLHVVAAPFSSINGKNGIFNSGILLSTTDNKVELITGLFFDFNNFYSINEYESALVNYYDTSRFSFLIIPIFINYYFSKKKFTPFLSAGILLKKEVNLTGNIQHSDINYENEYDYPLQLGVGGAYTISKQIKIYCEPFIRTKGFCGVLIGLSYNLFKFQNK